MRAQDLLIRMRTILAAAIRLPNPFPFEAKYQVKGTEQFREKASFTMSSRAASSRFSWGPKGKGSI